MKQGLTYISDRTKQLRYASATKTVADNPGIIGNDENEQWLQPISIYYAHETIKRGDPVSIAEVTNPGQASDPYPYVGVTDARIHTKCIGIALEPATAGQAVHVQPFGKIIYNDDKDSTKEKKLSVDFGTLKYRDLAGKVVYIGQEKGTFTTDFDKAYSNGHNIIQVGVITDAPAEDNQKEYAIELQPEADGRGPLDSTQFEFTVGETLSFKPHEIKVLALAKGKTTNSNFKASIAGALNGDKGFILFISVDGTGHKIYGNPTSIDSSSLDSAFLSKAAGYSQVDLEGSIVTLENKDYYVYISAKAKPYVSVTVLNRPQLAENGTLVAAHAGYSNRSNVIGIYQNGESARTFNKDSKLKVIKQGLISVKDSSMQLTAGSKYYLTNNGQIDSAPDPLYDRVICIGTASENNQFIVDCHCAATAHYGTKPVGYTKPRLGDALETGYLAFNDDGVVKVSASQAPSLFNLLKASGLDPVDGIIAYKNTSLKGYQIKYIDEGFDDPAYPRIPFININGIFSANINGATTVSLNPNSSSPYSVEEQQGYDVSSLIYWAPFGTQDSLSTIGIDSLDVHLSVDIGTEESHNWVEIYPGFNQYESNIYGFNWVLKSVNNKWILSIDTGAEGNYGIAYTGDPSKAPTRLNGYKYKIYVARRDNGYGSFDIGSAVSAITQQTFDPNSTLPISGKGVNQAKNSINSRLEMKHVLDSTRKLDENIIGDNTGNIIEDSSYSGLLSSNNALRALYEINSVIYKYKEDHEDAKPFIGVLIDQLEALVDGSDDASHTVPAQEDELVNYSLTEEQLAKIKQIISLLYNDKSSAQVVSSSIGLLIKAAGETQKRLLDIETAVFGRDYETIPDSSIEKSKSDIYTNAVSSLPAQLGLVRITNAVSKEVLGSPNPIGDAANPDQSSNGNRIKDLYKQIEGTNGDYGEAGIELNLLDGKIDSRINSAQSSAGAVNETHNEIGSNSVCTYPVVTYGKEGATSLNPTEPRTRAPSQNTKYGHLEGINDAINRIIYKLNMLTMDIHGYDDIESSAVRLDSLRTRTNALVSKLFFKASEIAKKYDENSSFTEKRGAISAESIISPDNNEYAPDFTATINLDAVNSLADIYFGDLYSKWVYDYCTGFNEQEDGQVKRRSIIENIKDTLGYPILPQSLKDEDAGHISGFPEVSTPRNKLSHCARLYNIEQALDQVITALFKGTDDNDEVADDYGNLNSIIETQGDQGNKADISRIQSDWFTNNGFETLNKLIFGTEAKPGNVDTNIINTILKELTGADQYIDGRSSFTTETPFTFIDLFKKYLEAGHYNINDDTQSNSLKDYKIIPADEIFEIRETGLFYSNESVLDHTDLKNRNIFYAKATDIVSVSADKFVRSYTFRPDIVYQFYRSSDNKFSLVNDYSAITLQAGETIEIFGENQTAVAKVTIRANADGKMEIQANDVKSLVIPSKSSELPGSLYIG